MDDLGTNPARRPTVSSDTLHEPAAFAGSRYRFTSGVRAGENVSIRGENGDVVLTYTSFASAIGIVAALMSGIVAVAGVAAGLYLSNEGRTLPAIAAVMLAVFFALFIAMLVPSTSVPIREGDVVALTIAQQSRFAFPRVAFQVMTPEGDVIAVIRRSILSRLGRNRWTIVTPVKDRQIADATEESLSRAITRKFAGKFNRKFESNVRIRAGYETIGWIVRRPASDGEFDVLDLSGDSGKLLDRRVAVALATLVLGSEP
ncbi:MAG: hypothetical protein ACXVH7_06685 [Thermoanaerobaculia bacterium]